MENPQLVRADEAHAAWHPYGSFMKSILAGGGLGALLTLIGLAIVGAVSQDENRAGGAIGVLICFGGMAIPLGFVAGCAVGGIWELVAVHILKRDSDSESGHLHRRIDRLQKQIDELEQERNEYLDVIREMQLTIENLRQSEKNRETSGTEPS